MTLPELVVPAEKQTLLDQIDREYADFTALLLARPEAQRAEVWDDGRSFKDLTAHVADWEAYALGRLRNQTSPIKTKARVFDDGDIDRINAEIQAKYADISWAEAWEFLESTHKAMRAHLDAMPEEDIFDESRSVLVLGDTDGNVLNKILYDTSHHYREHADEIRATVGA
jgi:hypothetical protein